MAFPLSPALPFVAFVSVVTASFLNTVRICINEALDGTGGGTYAPGSQITVGGAGLKLTGATALELDATSVVTQDLGGVFNVNGTVSITNTGLLQVQSAGQLSILNSGNLTIFGLAIVEGGGQLTINAGGTEEIVPGALSKVDAGIGTTIAVASNGAVLPQATIHVASTAGLPGEGWIYDVALDTLVFYTGILGGNTLTGCTGGSGTLATGQSVRNDGLVRIFGRENVEAGGVIDVLASGLIKLESGAEMDIQSGATVIATAGSTVTLGGSNTLSGTNLLSGATTQTNTYTQSGANAYRVGRTTTISSSQAVNAWNYECIILTGGGAGTLTLNTPTGIPDGVPTRICARGTGLWTIADSSGAVVAGTQISRPTKYAGFIDIVTVGSANEDVGCYPGS